MLNLRGIHNKSGFPTKKLLQTHLPVLSSQEAPIPQTIVSHFCRHLPDTQLNLPSHGTPGPQISLLQAPPGKGLPTIPSGQTQVGPVFEMIH